MNFRKIFSISYSEFEKLMLDKMEKICKNENISEIETIVKILFEKIIEEKNDKEKTAFIKILISFAHFNISTWNIIKKYEKEIYKLMYFSSKTSGTHTFAYHLYDTLVDGPPIEIIKGGKSKISIKHGTFKNTKILLPKDGRSTISDVVLEDSVIIVEKGHRAYVQKVDIRHEKKKN